MTKFDTIKNAPQRPGAVGCRARRYAQAFYRYAEEQAEIEASVEDAARFADALTKNPQLVRFITDKSISKSDSVDAIKGVLDLMSVGDVLRRFVGVVAQNRRLHDLQAIFSGIAALDRVRRGAAIAEVRSATELTDAQREVIRARLAQDGHGHLEIIDSVDPSLIGGLTIKIGAKLFDSSISGRLTRLQFAMKGAA